MPTLRSTVFATVLLAALATTAFAAWPARVFIPYVYLGNNDNFKLTACDDSIGLKHYTLAFIIADSKHNPAWFGQIPMSQNFYGDQIAAIRQRGGDVVCSFGGADGKEIAIVEPDVAALQAKYQSVVDQYQFTWLDFDVEGDNLDKHPDANKRRNLALAALQKKNPGLLISYTLPVDPNGLSQSSLNLLSDAKSAGVTIHSANIMVMYFGTDFLKGGKSEGQLGIDSANKAREQIAAINPAIQIGLCPCIGTNGSKAEIFTQSDATILKSFADTTPWVCSLSYWSMNRDSELNKGEDTTSEIPAHPWDFANNFKTFTTPAK